MNDDREAKVAAQRRVWHALETLGERFEELLRAARVDVNRPELWSKYLDRRESFDRECIPALRDALAAALPSQERTVSQPEPLALRCFAALLIHHDERELSVLSKLPLEQRPELWQTKYCHIYDGGERFFGYLDDALRDPGTPPLMLQVFLYCLRSGYCGRYVSASHEARLARVEELRARVFGGREATLPVTSEARREPERVRGVGFPYADYGTMILVVLCVYLGLKSLASIHRDSSDYRPQCRDFYEQE